MATSATETLNGQMMDALRQIDERLRRLEEQVAAMTRAMPPQEPQEPWWKPFCGVFEGSEVSESVRKRIQRDRRADYAKVAAEMDRQERKTHRKAKRSRAGK